MSGAVVVNYEKNPPPGDEQYSGSIYFCMLIDLCRALFLKEDDTG
jgi:hypothetical protein